MSSTRASGTKRGTELTQESVFEVLSCRRRRHAIHYLLHEEDPVSLHELSKQLAAWENDVPAEAVTYKQRMRLYTALRQVHLPKMDDEGVVVFDADAGVVHPTEAATELEVYLDIVPYNEIPWSSYYLGLGVMSGGLVVVAGFGVFPFSMLPDLAWAGVVTVLFLASALAHVHHERRYRLGRGEEPPV